MIFVVEAVEVAPDGAPVGQWHRCSAWRDRRNAVADAERDRPVRYKARIRETLE